MKNPKIEEQDHIHMESHIGFQAKAKNAF